MLQLILVAAIVVVLFYYIAVRPLSYWKLLGVKQLKPMWFFGDQWKTLTKQQCLGDMVRYIYDAAPGVRYFGIYLFTTPALVLKDLDLIKQITVKDFENFSDHRSLIPDDIDPLWTRNIFSLKGQRWREIRPLLTPSFTSSKMKTMFVLMSECAQTFTKFFVNTNEDSIEIELKDAFSRYTNDVIASTAFGVNTDSLKYRTNQFYLMGREVSDFSRTWRNLKIFGYLIIPKVFSFFRIGLFEKHVGKYFTDLIYETMKMRKEKGIIRPDMLQLLMDAQKESENLGHKVEENGLTDIDNKSLVKGTVKEMTPVDIAAQALIFFFAGFDAVSGLMCFMSYELAIHPDIQQKLRNEIEQTLKECNGKVTYDAIMKMKYMDMVVSEAIRKWPNAAAIDRVCTKPYTIQPVTPDEKPLHIKAGAILWLPIYALLRDPEHFPDPDRFDPERFSYENKGNVNPYAYIPFGVGPRNCIASRFALLETKVVFFHLLSDFEIVPNSKSKIPLELSTRQFNLNAAGGFWFNLKRLKK